MKEVLITVAISIVVIIIILIYCCLVIASESDRRSYEIPENIRLRKRGSKKK